MNPPTTQHGTVRFGCFEADFESGIVRKRGIRIKLPAQPLSVLQALLEKPGAVVTREELRQTLWPNHTFVDFEHGLNAAVSRLRQALGDAGGRSRYIETVSKRGYRFAAEVERPTAVEAAPAQPAAPPARKPMVPMIVLVVGILIAALGVISFSFRRGPTLPLHAPEPRATPLTTFPGNELDPALSPDGNSVAFTWNGEREDNFDIYVLRIGSNVPVRLTTDPADDFGPAWSPDGTTIAFSRSTGADRGRLMVVPASGGRELELAQTCSLEFHPAPLGRRMPSVAWTPDGRWVAAAHREPVDAHDRIYLFSLTGQRRPLTRPPEAYHGDYMPAFSPDGRAVAFCRLSGFSASEIYLQPLDTTLQPAGTAHALTNYKRWAVNPVWVRNGRSLLYVLGERPDAILRREVRMIDSSGNAESDRVIPLGEPAYQVTASRRLVYSTLKRETDIWRAKVTPVGQTPGGAELFISSTWPDSKARYSPDGKNIAFVSERSGWPEIWMSTAAGSNQTKITSFGGPVIGPPSWSPDGHSLVFHARSEGHGDLYAIAATGGSPVRLTTNPADDVMPAYSHDGRWIYFNSLRTGQHQIWKMPAAGGEAIQLTTHGGQSAAESTDGNTVYYVTGSGKEIWQVPSNGGPETRLAGPVNELATGFAVTSKGIYYAAPPHSGEECFIRFFNFASHESRPVARVSRPGDWTLSVSPDDEYLLVSLKEKPKHDLMLSESFVPDR